MLFNKYPELKWQAPNAKVYKRYDTAGNLVEMWEKDENGVWKDVTKRELTRQKVEKLQAELAKLLKISAKSPQNAQTACPVDIVNDDFDDLVDDFEHLES